VIKFLHVADCYYFFFFFSFKNFDWLFYFCTLSTTIS